MASADNDGTPGRGVFLRSAASCDRCGPEKPPPSLPPLFSAPGERSEMVVVTVMVMVATLTRTTAACPLDHKERCAKDGVSGVEGEGRRGRREDKRVGKDERERVCVWSGEECGEGRESGSVCVRV